MTNEAIKLLKENPELIQEIALEFHSKVFDNFVLLNGKSASDSWTELIKEYASEKRDWVVTKFKSNTQPDNFAVANLNGTFGTSNMSVDVFVKLQAWCIYSVNRLSDGVEFSVGDKVQTIGTIAGFQIKETEGGGLCMCVSFVGGEQYFHCPLSQLSKRVPLFATQDNQPVFEGAEYWVVLDDFKIHRLTAIKGCSMTHQIIENPGHNRKSFSTESAAKEYVIMNRPCLSAKDIYGLWAIDEVGRRQLFKLVNSKLK